MTSAQVRTDIDKLFKIVELIGKISPKLETMEFIENGGTKVEVDISDELVKMETLIIEVLEGKNNVALEPLPFHKKDYLKDSYVVKDLVFGDFALYLWKTIKDLHNCFQIDKSVIAQNFRDFANEHLKVALRALQAKTRV